MEAEMEHKPDNMEDDMGRERFRRYRKRRSHGPELLSPEVQRIVSFTNELLDATPMQEASPGNFETPARTTKFFPNSLTPDWSAVRKREPDEADGLSLPAPEAPGSEKRAASRHLTKPVPSPAVLRAVKQEPGEDNADSAESSFARFSSLMSAAIQGMITFPEVMQHFDIVCRELAESVREEAADRHRVTEDRLMRQKGQMLYGEAASWALLWHLFGKGMEDVYSQDCIVSPATSLQGACEFIATDQTAQLSLRIVQWLEELASKELDSEKQKKGWYAGSYGQNLGIWHQTKRAIRKKAGQATLVQHLDPDAPTRENARIHPEDQKLEEGLLEDLWRLLRAGRLEEARQLCRNAGQHWRAASLGGCGEVGCSPSVEAWAKKGKDRSLQALELESGHGHQRRLWKWACFCASEKIGEREEGRYEAAVYATQCSNVKRMLPVCLDWESACWALVRSWLDVQVDMELLQRSSKLNGAIDGAADVDMETTAGPTSWPHAVLDQQPRDLFGLFQRLHSGDLVHENVHRSSKEQQRLVQMDLMLGDIGHLLDSLRGWVVPRENGDVARPHGHPQMIRFGAHLVLVLRHILPEEAKEHFREKLWLIGDLILNTYAIFLFTQQKEELVGIYASQLAPHLCVELYVHMMDLRQNDSAIVKYKIFRSAVEYLPFTSEDGTKGSVEEILERVLIKSRDLKPGVRHVKEEEAGEHQKLESARKAHIVQWLCFTPPSNVADAEVLSAQLLVRALHHCNLLFREFALISLWRTSKPPAGAHVLLGHLAEPLKQPTDILLALNHLRVEENLLEFNDWREYYACDALYRNWYTSEVGNLLVPAKELSFDEQDQAIRAARQAFDSALALLNRDGLPWLAEENEGDADDQLEAVEWLEVRVTAVLTSAAGICLIPDATVCTALTSALYSSVSDQVVVERELTVNVSVNLIDESYVDVVLKCRPEEGDGIGAPSSHDGGVLGGIMAAAVKGELPHFQVGYALEVARVDAWYITADGDLQVPAVYITRGLCRRCCLPELILRSMQMLVFLARARADLGDASKKLVRLVVQKRLESLFSKRQLQELLHLERDIWIQKLATREEDLGA